MAAVGQRPTIATNAHAIESGYLIFNADPGNVTHVPLWVPDRKVVIESATMRYATAAGVPNFAWLAQIGNGYAMTDTDATHGYAAITVPTSVAVGAFDLDSLVVDTNQTGIFVPNTATVSGKTPTANIVPAGSLLFLKTNGAIASNMSAFILSIRYTTVIQ